MRKLLLCAAVSALLSGSAVPATAEGVSISTKLDVFSSYVWRGITANNRTVMQPGIYMGTAFAGGTLTAGLWESTEPFSATATDISQRGFENPGVGEVDYSVEWSHSIAKATATLGAVQYTFHGSALSSTVNTSELYAKAAFAGPLSPSFALYVDVDKVKGAYLEAGVAHSVKFGTRNLDLGAKAGYCAGQSYDPAQLANFFGEGMSHVDLMAKMKFVAGPITWSPLAHVVFNVDERTKLVNLNPNSLPTDSKVWGGVSFAWSR